MDAIDGSSDVEESQATQMLIDLIPRSSSVLDPLSPALPAAKIQSPLALPADVTESFGSSRHSNSLPTYHYHGLASTQTQTQTQTNDEDVEMQEGSQKENIQNNPVATTGELRQTPLVQKIAPNPFTSNDTPSRSGQLEQMSHSRLSHGKARTPNTRPVAINSLDSPSTRLGNASSRGGMRPARKTPARTLPTRQSKRRPSPVSYPEESQDSFAQDPLQDPEELFIARNELLNRPLSELGRVESPEQEDFDALSANRSSMLSRQEMHNPLGNILVESTPSQSQSQEEATQIIEAHWGKPPTTSLPSARSSSPPSLNSSGGMSCFGDGSQRYAETQQTVQTQPLTQLVDEDLPDDPLGDRAAAASYLATVGTSRTTATTTTTTTARSILRTLVDRHKVDGHDHPLPRLAPEPEAFVETQPSTDFHPQPRPNISIPRRPAQATARTPVRIPQPVAAKSTDDVMDIIPDSEPQPVALSPEAADEQDSGDEDNSGVLPQTSRRANHKGKGRATIQDDETDEEDELLLARLPAVPEPQEGEEDDDDDDDDDVPLATKSAMKMKGRKGGKNSKTATPVMKAKAANADSVPSAQKKSAGKKAEPKAKETKAKGATAKAKTATPRGRVNRSSDSSESNFVPSSVPLQDYAPTSAPVKAEKAAKKTPARAPVKPPAPRSRRKTQKRNYQDPPTDDEEVVEETEDPLRVPPSLGRGDEEVDEYVEATPDPEATNRRGKRKLAKPVIKQERNKRFRAGASFKTESEEVVAATRVFALWKKTDDYYAGTVYSPLGKQAYTIKFDDGQDGDVALTDMRKLDLHVDDTVFLHGETQPLRVTNVDYERSIVAVRQKSRTKEIPLRRVRIPCHEIDSHWDDRIFERGDEIIPKVRSAKSPAPLPPSLVDGPKTKGKLKNKILARTGVVITRSKSCPNTLSLKTDLGRMINEMGGTMLSDFLPYLNMDGIFDRGNGRWRISKRDVRWTHKDLDRLFLVADNITQKPRYLLAIALGVPCISEQWLHDCHKCDASDDEPEWQRYLLPQACLEEPRQYRLSQQVDLDWGESASDLTYIMDNPAPSKLFDGGSILCAGPLMLPQPENSTHPEVAATKYMQTTVNALARIVLAMGAETVEAVENPNMASAPLDEYTWIVTFDFDAYTHKWPHLPEDKWVTWAWVKESLLASRLLPRPNPPLVEEESQDI